MASRTQVEVDTFDSALSSDWTQVNNGIAGAIVHTGSGSVRGSFGEQSPHDHSAARRNTTAATGVGADQYATIVAPVWTNVGAAQGSGCLLCSTGANGAKSGYELWASANNVSTAAIRLIKWVAGTPTVVAPAVDVAMTANDALTLEKLGGQLRAYKNGVEIASLAYLDGSPLTTGTFGLSSTSSTSITSWEGGSVAAGDTTAPTLTSPTGTSTGSTTASGTVSTDEANGTLYRLASTNATELAATVKAAALTSSVTATGAQAVSFTGLTPSTTYYAHYVHTDAAGNDSTRVSSASFTTSAGGDTTAPTLSSPTGTGGSGVCTGSVSTNEANGTLYVVFTGSATAPTAVQVEAGQDNTGAAALRAVNQAVNATGSQSIASGSITAGTRYAHFMHKDAAGNRSTVASSASFVVTAPVTASLTSSPLKNNTGTVLAAVAFEAFVNNPSTGALVLKKTGLTSNGSGVVTFTDAALTAATSYRVTWRRTDTGAEGLETLTAA